MARRVGCLRSSARPGGSRRVRTTPAPGAIRLARRRRSMSPSSRSTRERPPGRRRRYTPDTDRVAEQLDRALEVGAVAHADEDPVEARAAQVDPRIGPKLLA